ncbi:MAG: flagellar biosynthetic protein FliO [Phycisphaerales bacterium]|nr:flagellar biosynthetic protein FliO [Phycisphaerales bacterium]
MQIRLVTVFAVFSFACVHAPAQIGPTAQDEPLRSMSSASIHEDAAAKEPVTQEPRFEPTISLDDALIAAGSRSRPEQDRVVPLAPVSAESRSQATPDSQALGTLGRTTLVGVESESSSSPMMSRGSMLQTVLALGGVLLLIFGLATLYKRLAKTQGGLAGALGAGGSAPGGLVEVLGRYPVSSKMTLVVMRFDRRILLLSHAGGGRGKNASLGAMTTLCELDKPEDVASVLLKVRDIEGDSIARSFARTLQEADESQDRYLEEPVFAYEQPRVRVPSRRRQPAQVVTNDAGDRAEFGVMTESEAAAGVLRRRLAAMREAEQQMNPYGATR